MRVAIIGANGQLGSDIAAMYKEREAEVIPLNHEDIEIGDSDSVRSILQEVAPEIVVNTAAMHNVDLCEEDPQQAFLVNGLGAKNLATVSNEIDYILVHISTDYVFDGKKSEPYVETDQPRPLNVYGNTKLSGEHFIEAIAEKYHIIRVSALYGAQPCRAKGGLNFVSLMLKLGGERDEVRVVDSEMISPTYTLDAARQIEAIARSGQYGLFHATSMGCCSWYEFAREVFSITNVDVKLSVASSDEFPAKTQRPIYSVLDNHACRAAGLDLMPHWRDSLLTYLKDQSESGVL